MNQDAKIILIEVNNLIKRLKKGVKMTKKIYLFIQKINIKKISCGCRYL